MSPGTATVRAGDTQAFTAVVTGTSNTAVTWTVTCAAGVSACGTIDATGLFTAPASVPSSNTATVQATSQANAALQGTSSVTLQNPIPVVASVTPNTVGVGAPTTLVVTGTKFVNGAKVFFGTTALPTVFNGNTTALSASVTASASQTGSVTVTVQNPDPGLVASATSKAVAVVNGGPVATDAATVRFLEQSTFGPTPQLVSQVKLTGFSPFLSDQFAANVSTFPDPAGLDITNNNQVPTQRALFTNALANPDQLRQRVAFALSQIWVTSGISIHTEGIAPYLRLLTQDAFVNYRQIMYDVTLSPTMGRYLDMVNNGKPTTAANTHANENYAREVMQLFTLGLYKLNQDGSLQHDASGNPIPTYTQNDVQALALALTGWTYGPNPPTTSVPYNPPYWLGPMMALDSNHDTTTPVPAGGTTRAFLGTTLPLGRTAAQDLGGTAVNSSGALDVIFNNASLPPFVCKQLIQHLVSSNPSAAYVRRVADVFASGSFAGFGSGQRGDMQAVIAAILLDPEATTSVATGGHLREPILFIANLLRAFGAASDGSAAVTLATNLGEPPWRPNSVFNFFPPDFVIPLTNPALLGPEFDLQTVAQAQARINFVNSFAFTSIGAGTTLDFTTYTNLAAADPSGGQLVDALNTLLLHGSMSSSMRSSILTAIAAVPSGTSQNALRAKTAIYLVASSSQYQVQH
jgi:uncharacterized protein (DUF1800 family)